MKARTRKVDDRKLEIILWSHDRELMDFLSAMVWFLLVITARDVAKAKLESQMPRCESQLNQPVNRAFPLHKPRTFPATSTLPALRLPELRSTHLSHLQPPKLVLLRFPKSPNSPECQSDNMMLVSESVGVAKIETPRRAEYMQRRSISENVACGQCCTCII